MINRDEVVRRSKLDCDIKDHLLMLYDLVVEIKAQVVVELGAGHSTYALMAGVNKTGGCFWSVDHRSLPSIDNPRYSRNVMDDMEYLKQWSREIDVLFIDTSHKYEHTKRELAGWFPWVRVGGVIALHDTDGQDGENPGCRQALDEFLEKNKGAYKETYYPYCNGLSVIKKLR